MIRAVYRDGAIHALQELPVEWQEGQELVVDALPADESHESFDEWVADIRAAAAGITDEDHDRLMATLQASRAAS